MRQYAELALILLIDDLCRRPHGRLRGLCAKAANQARNQAKFLPKLSQDDGNKLCAKLDEFLDAYRSWQTRGIHACTYVSFILDLIDHRPWPEIKKTLCEIIDYYERADNMPTPSTWAGALAGDKFNFIFGEKDA